MQVNRATEGSTDHKDAGQVPDKVFGWHKGVCDWKLLITAERPGAKYAEAGLDLRKRDLSKGRHDRKSHGVNGWSLLRSGDALRSPNYGSKMWS